MSDLYHKPAGEPIKYGPPTSCIENYFETVEYLTEKQISDMINDNTYYELGIKTYAIGLFKPTEEQIELGKIALLCSIADPTAHAIIRSPLEVRHNGDKVMIRIRIAICKNMDDKC